MLIGKSGNLMITIAVHDQNYENWSGILVRNAGHIFPPDQLQATCDIITRY